jgi:hypothetical protein
MTQPLPSILEFRTQPSLAIRVDGEWFPIRVHAGWESDFATWDDCVAFLYQTAKGKRNDRETAGQANQSDRF